MQKVRILNFFGLIIRKDITDGKIKLILGLIWTLILKYQISKNGPDSQAKSELLKWVQVTLSLKFIIRIILQSKIPDYNIQNFGKGDAFPLIVLKEIRLE